MIPNAQEEWNELYHWLVRYSGLFPNEIRTLVEREMKERAATLTYAATPEQLELLAVPVN